MTNCYYKNTENEWALILSHWKVLWVWCFRGKLNERQPRIPFPLWLSQQLLWACQSVLFPCHSEDWGQCHKHKGTCGWVVDYLSKGKGALVYSFTVSVKKCNSACLGGEGREDFSVHGCIDWNEDCQVKIMQDREFQTGTWHSRYQILIIFKAAWVSKSIQVRKN